MAELESSSALRSAKLNATRALIDSGDSFGKIQFFGGMRLPIDDEPTGTLIVEVPLTKPCGYIDSAGLHLTPSGAGQVFAAQTIAWARVVTSGDTPVFAGGAAQIGEAGSDTAAFLIDVVSVARGGFLTVSTVTITEP